MEYESQTYNTIAANWPLYLVPFSSSDFLPDTDIPLEVMMMQCPSNGSEDHMMVWLAVKRADGCLRLGISKVMIMDDVCELNDLLVRQLAADLRNNQDLFRRLSSVIAELEAEDPLALPQRNVPDFLHSPGKPLILPGFGFGARIPTRLLGIRDDEEFVLLVDVLRPKRYTKAFVRTWVIWSEGEYEEDEAHQVCWLLLSDVNPEDISNLLYRILRSPDFSSRFRLLHDRWRTAIGMPPVSTPEEKTLLPIPEGLPKPAARGLSTKRRKRR